MIKKKNQFPPQRHFDPPPPFVLLSDSSSQTLWIGGSQPVSGDQFGGGAEPPFQRGHPRPSENTDIYVMIYNSNKIILMKYQEKLFYGCGSSHHEEYYKAAGSGREPLLWMLYGNSWSWLLGPHVLA